jgi:hypothetical protein
MKKYLAVIGAMILVMALASPVLAADEWMKEFKTSSLIQIWSMWENKADFGINTWGNKERTQKYLGERINFSLEWGNSKYAHGVLAFEADSSNYGEPGGGGTDGNAASYALASSANHMGAYRADQVQLEIKNAYLDFTIPNTPIQIYAGIQTFYYGGRLFMLNDAPGFKVAATFAPHRIEAFMWRESEDTTTDGRYRYKVNDTYGLHYSLFQKEFNVYAYGAYKNNLSNDTYSDKPYWIGVGGGFRPGNINLSGQFVYLGGKRDMVVGNDIDYSAYAGEIRAQYTIGPGLSVALEGYYSTGNDTDNTSKIKRYTGPTSSESNAIFGNDRTVFFFMAFSNFGNQPQKEYYAGGYWYGLANVNYTPLPWLNLGFNYLYIGDTSKGEAAGMKNTTTYGAAQQVKDESFVGHEINLITKLKIYQNLTYQIGIAAFLPGAVYDQYTGTTKTKSPDTAYAVNTGMQLAF